MVGRFSRAVQKGAENAQLYVARQLMAADLAGQKEVVIPVNDMILAQAVAAADNLGWHQGQSTFWRNSLGGKVYRVTFIKGQAPTTPTAPVNTKTCPMCAEDVKAAAKVCRYCGHEF